MEYRRKWNDMINENYRCNAFTYVSKRCVRSGNKWMKSEKRKDIWMRGVKELN